MLNYSCEKLLPETDHPYQLDRQEFEKVMDNKTHNRLILVSPDHHQNCKGCSSEYLSNFIIAPIGKDSKKRERKKYWNFVHYGSPLFQWKNLRWSFKLKMPFSYDQDDERNTTLIW